MPGLASTLELADGHCIVLNRFLLGARNGLRGVNDLGIAVGATLQPPGTKATTLCVRPSRL
jgi:hypothetical protein